MVVVVGLSLPKLLDRTVGKLGLGGLQRFATLGVGSMECCSVKRLGVDNDAAVSFAMENLTCCTLCD